MLHNYRELKEGEVTTFMMDVSRARFYDLPPLTKFCTPNEIIVET